MIRLTENDCELVSRYFPELNCELKNQRIWGTLKFTCHYNPSSEQLIFEMDKESITSTYEIEINFKEKHLKLPKTYEHSGIITAYAKKQSIKLIDLHMFSGNACCLGIYPEDENSSAVDFLVKRVIPFFYWQTYFRTHGKEPWTAYPHGERGYRDKYEELIEKIEETTGNMSNNTFTSIGSLRNKPCKCKSGKKYKKCCLNIDNQLRAKLNKLQKAKVFVSKWIDDCATKQP